jgi:hypothetical protein
VRSSLRTLLLALHAAALAQAQTDPTFRVDSQLALVRFHVSMSRPDAASALRLNDIRILEDGHPQKVAHLEGARIDMPGMPVEVILLFDCSRSVQNNGNLRPNVLPSDLLEQYGSVSVGVYGFSEDLTRLSLPGRNAASIRAALNRLPAYKAGDTAIFHSIIETMRDVPPPAAGTVRMLAVISDGESTVTGDNRLDRQAIANARDLGIAIYPVLLTVPNAVAAMREQMVSIRNFLDLAPATGGEVIPAPNTVDLLPRILKTIALRTEFDYVAGYYPQSADGVRHKVQIVWSDRNRGTILGGTRVVVH